MNKEYKNIKWSDIEDMIEDGELERVIAIKAMPVKAELITQEKYDEIMKLGGYETYIQDENGNEIEETTNKNLKVGEYLTTQIINGKQNSWIQSKENLYENYSKSGDVYIPKGEEKIVYRLPNELDVSFEAPWGSEIKINGGGVIVPDPSGTGFYGINPVEFAATHSEVSISDSVKNFINNMGNNDIKQSAKIQKPK